MRSDPTKNNKTFIWECNLCAMSTRLPDYITGANCPRCYTPMWFNPSGQVEIGKPEEGDRT